MASVAGRIVWIHQERQVNGQAVLRCALEPERDLRTLEIPQWMFDAASCASIRLDEQPAASAESLRELKGLVGLAAANGTRAGVLQDQHHSFYAKEVLMRSSLNPTGRRLNCNCFIRL